MDSDNSSKKSPKENWVVSDLSLEASLSDKNLSLSLKGFLQNAFIVKNVYANALKILDRKNVEECFPDVSSPPFVPKPVLDDSATFDTLILQILDDYCKRNQVTKHRELLQNQILLMVMSCFEWYLKNILTQIYQTNPELLIREKICINGQLIPYIDNKDEIRHAFAEAFVENFLRGEFPLRLVKIKDRFQVSLEQKDELRLICHWKIHHYLVHQQRKIRISI